MAYARQLMRLRVSAVLVLLTLAVLAARAQQPATQPTIDTPIFRSTVDAVELDAFVIDADGKISHNHVLLSVERAPLHDRLRSAIENALLTTKS